MTTTLKTARAQAKRTPAVLAALALATCFSPPLIGAVEAAASAPRPGLRRGSSSNAKSRPQQAEVPGRLLRTPEPEVVLGGTSMPADEAPPPDSQDPDRARILRLQEALSSIVHGPILGRLRVGMRVVEAATGRTFFRQHGTALMDPASNQKVLATTAALMRLGTAYRFRTELQGPSPDGDGVIHGDVVLRGSGDPSLGIPELNALAANLAGRGVTRIEGGVFADLRRIGSNESANDERSPLRVSRGSVLVRIRPGGSGGAPVISVRPSMDAIQIRNHASTTKGKVRGRLKVTVIGSGDGHLVVDVSGKIAANHPGMTMSRIPGNQRLFAAALLHEALRDVGITVKGPAGVGPGRPAPAGEGGIRLPPELLALHESLPLALLIRHINKDSNNEWAERLLDVVGAELYGGAATPDKGLRALREALDDLQVPRTSYVSTNGSGLGHGNRITADAMADLLHKLYTDPRWGPELMQSLSVGGVDGTTRNRFRGSPAAERVRAKTGTLDGKSCLSGFVGDRQEVLIFSIMVEGNKRRFATNAVRGAQVVAVNAMMRYARGVLDAPTGEEVNAGEDFEVGDDVLETDEDEGGPPLQGPEPKKEAPQLEPPPTRPQSLVPPPISAPPPSLVPARATTRPAAKATAATRPTNKPTFGALRR
jgi:D-alanyl-D-alanine carboxypeptidase/D-alanyl-D-alanine-endopeptidase (penicillin-binding protein 4)